LGPVLESIIPEMILVGVAVVLFIAAAFRTGDGRGWSTALGVLGCVGALVAAILLYRAGGTANGALVGDGLAFFAKMLFPLMGIWFVVLSASRVTPETAPEFQGTLLTSLAGMMLVGSAGDLITLFLGLELVSIPTYLLICLMRADDKTKESATKYFFLGVFASAVFLYGVSLLYGLGKTTSLAGLVVSLQGIAAGSVAGTLLVVALVLAALGLCYKIGAVPFHFYVPDVYQGAATPVTALLAFGPKAAGFLAIMRLITYAMAPASGASVALFWILAAVTMTTGNVLAMLQPNIKRMLAYSSIAHAGYMLMGIVVGFGGAKRFMGINGVAAVLVYLVAYGFMNLGAFAVLTALRRKGQSANTLDDVAGLHRRSPGMAAVMAICMFSLIGMPATAGFIGKLCIFSSLLAAEPGQVQYRYILAAIGALNAAIAAFYYLRVCARMYLHEPVGEMEVSDAKPIRATAWLCALATLLIGIPPGAVIDLARGAAPPDPRAAAPPAATAPAPTETTAER